MFLKTALVVFCILLQLTFRITVKHSYNKNKVWDKSQSI